jgi:hypothetical protein
MRHTGGALLEKKDRGLGFRAQPSKTVEKSSNLTNRFFRLIIFTLTKNIKKEA